MDFKGTRMLANPKTARTRRRVAGITYISVLEEETCSTWYAERHHATLAERDQGPRRKKRRRRRKTQKQYSILDQGMSLTRIMRIMTVLSTMAAAVWMGDAALPRLPLPRRTIPWCSHTISKHLSTTTHQQPQRPQTSCLTPTHNSNTCTLLYSRMHWPRLYPPWRKPTQRMAILFNPQHPPPRPHLPLLWATCPKWLNKPWRKMRSNWKHKLCSCAKAIFACTRYWQGK